MEQNTLPTNGLQRFMKSRFAAPTGLILALLLSILALYFGIFNQCCGLGYLVIACIALYVPKFFGVEKIQIMAVFGIVLFLTTVLLGAFMISKPMFDGTNDTSSYDSDGFSNVTIAVSGSAADVTATYSGSAASVKFCFYQVTFTTYNFANTFASKDYEYEMTAGDPYTVHLDNVSSGSVYQFMFKELDAEGNVTNTSSSSYYSGAATDSDITKFCLMNNAYTCGIIVVLFFLMIALTAWSRKNLEKTRARMEAEGRLYPQGYGRCKDCGSIVLPGETVCRKCGAYINIPDDLRHKKVNMVQCSECGSEIPEDATVCPKCGATFDEEEEIVYVENDKEK